MDIAQEFIFRMSAIAYFNKLYASKVGDVFEDYVKTLGHIKQNTCIQVYTVHQELT